MDPVTIGVARSGARKDAGQRYAPGSVQSLQSDSGATRQIPAFSQANGGNPIFTAADVGFSGISWTSTLRMDTLVDNPLDKYYKWISTDHGTEGGFYLATAPTPLGPWTQQGRVYVDTVTGSQTETPQVIYWEKDPDGLPFYAYYQQAATGIDQATLLARSADGINWVRYGVVLTLPDRVQFAGSGHTGYFIPHRFGDKIGGWHLTAAGNYSFQGYSESTDGRNFVTDPRRMGQHADLFPTGPSEIGPRFKLIWIHAAILMLGGKPWWLGFIGQVGTSGTDIGEKRLAIAPLAPNLRSVLAPPTIIGPAPGEAVNLRSVNAFVDDGKIYVDYLRGNTDLCVLVGSFDPDAPQQRTAPINLDGTGAGYGKLLIPRLQDGSVMPLGRVRQKVDVPMLAGALPAGWDTVGTQAFDSAGSAIPRLKVTSAAAVDAEAVLRGPSIDLTKLLAVEFTIEGIDIADHVEAANADIELGFGLFAPAADGTPCGLDFNQTAASGATRLTIHQATNGNPAVHYSWRGWAGARHNLTMRIEMGYQMGSNKVFDHRAHRFYLMEDDQCFYSRQLVSSTGVVGWVPGVVRPRFYVRSKDGAAKTLRIAQAKLILEHN